MRCTRAATYIETLLRMASGIPFNPHLTARASAGVGMCPISGDPAQNVPDLEAGTRGWECKMSSLRATSTRTSKS